MFDRSLANEYSEYSPLRANALCSGVAPTRSQRARQSVEERRRARLEREQQARRHEQFRRIISVLDGFRKKIVARVSGGASTKSAQ